jgi:hypothetical protein
VLVADEVLAGRRCVMNCAKLRMGLALSVILVLLLAVGCKRNHPPATPDVTGLRVIRPSDTATLSATSTDQDDDLVSYLFAWGDTSSTAWSPDYPSGVTVTRSHVYADSGEFAVRTRARDDKGAESDWSPTETLRVGFFPPGKPARPAGPTAGLTGIAYEYSTHATSPFGESLSIQFDWDESLGSWSTLVASDSPCIATYAFESAGGHAVRARARDSVGKLSPWSDSMLVAITYQDRTDPTVAVVYPKDGSAVDVGPVAVKAVATDNIRATRVEFLDGATKIGEDTTANADTFDVNWIATAGTHILKAVAWDSAGNSGEHMVSVQVGGPTHHSGQIDTNEVWYPGGNPHILDSDVYTGDNVTLTILPGCYVQFPDDVELYTGYAHPGSIIAVGKADSMITFTSLSDTVAGFWKDISFEGNTMSTAHMSYCNVLFGGKVSDQTGAVEVHGCVVKLDHNLVRKSGYDGVWTTYDGYFSDFSNNTVTGCSQYPVHIGAANVATLGAGNTLTGNSKDAIQVDGSEIKSDGTWLNHGVPYVITDDAYVDNDATLTIAAGTTIALNPQVEFYVGYASPGGLIADSVTFTSSVSSPSAGDWRRLSFYGNSINSQCQLKNCKVWYGGFSGYGDIYISDCTPTITSCDIGYSSAYGIYLTGSEYPDPAQLLANNTFHDNVSGAVRVPPGK